MLAKYRYVKHYIFTGTDLDSVTSYMVFNWLSDKRIPVQYVRRDNIEEAAKKFLADHPDTLVYFINLDTSGISNIVDRRNVVIIDHHKSHIDKKSVYSNCKPILKNYSSCCKLIYTLLRKRLSGKLTTDQLRLMFMVDDHESYTFNLPNSYELGIVFNNLQGDKSVRFYSKFVNGFTKFDSNDNNTITFFKKRVGNVTSQLSPFTANIQIGDKKYKFISVFVDGYINEVSDFLLNKYGCDICLTINLENKRVSFRRDKKCKLNLKRLSEKLCNGWGYEYAAGGDLTDKLLQFSKVFLPVK